MNEKPVVPAGLLLLLLPPLLSLQAINQSVLRSDGPIKGEADSVRVQRNPPGKASWLKGSLLLLCCEISKATLPPE